MPSAALPSSSAQHSSRYSSRLPSTSVWMQRTRTGCAAFRSQFESHVSSRLPHAPARPEGQLHEPAAHASYRTNLTNHRQLSPHQSHQSAKSSRRTARQAQSSQVCSRVESSLQSSQVCSQVCSQVESSSHRRASRHRRRSLRPGRSGSNHIALLTYLPTYLLRPGRSGRRRRRSSQPERHHLSTATSAHTPSTARCWRRDRVLLSRQLADSRLIVRAACGLDRRLIRTSSGWRRVTDV